MLRALLVLRALALLVSGVLVGAAAVVTHDRVPGLVLGLLASAAATWALPGGWSSRFAFTSGWALLLAYVLLPRPGGGYLVQADLEGYLLLAYGLVQLLLGIVTVRPLRPPAGEPVDPT